MQQKSITISCAIFLLFFLLIAASAWMSPIEFDSAFNLQVAISLQEQFSYQSRYIPTEIYHHQITTNGPIQYGMALLLGLFGLDLGYAIGLGLIGGLCAVSIYRFCPHSFRLYCLLLCFWPLFASAHNTFCGEIFAIAMTMVGLTQWNAWVRLTANPSDVIIISPPRLSPQLWIAGLAFGSAIATKLISAGVIPLILLTLLASDLRQHPFRARAQIPRPVLHLFLLPLLIAAVFFLLQFSLSILHSGSVASDILPTLRSLFGEHLHQANKARSAYDLQHIYLQSYEIPILILLITASGFLLYKNIVFALPITCIMALLVFGHMNLRRMLPLVVPLLLIASNVASSQPTSTPWRRIRRHMPLLFSGTTLVCGSLFLHTPLYLFDTLQHFSWTKGAPHNVAIVTTRTTYNDKLITMIQRLDGPVFTSRWWQFPEISLRAGVAFYDRLSHENSLLLADQQAYLLFSSKNAEDILTETTLCGTILFRDGNLILCKYRPQGR